MSEENTCKTGDLVQVHATGRIVRIYPGRGYLVNIHGEEVPMGFEQVKLLHPEPEQPKKGE